MAIGYSCAEGTAARVWKRQGPMRLRAPGPGVLP